MMQYEIVDYGKMQIKSDEVYLLGVITQGSIFWLCNDYFPTYYCEK